MPEKLQALAEKADLPDEARERLVKRLALDNYLAVKSGFFHVL